MNQHQAQQCLKRVGIVTMHRVANYGSVLQTYALQRSIAGFGYDCEVIDYIFPNDYHRKTKAPAPVNVSLIQKLKNNAGTFLTRQKKREHAFSAFLADHLTLSKQMYPSIESLRQTPPQYDIYVSGSDQVWNTKYVDEDPTFLLDFAPGNAKRISYAASFGDSRFDERYVDLYRKHLSKFAHISVREVSGKRIVTDLVAQEAHWVLDPSMLLSADDWKSLIIEPRLKKKYILCYFLGYTYNPQPYADLLAKQLRKATGYELVFIAPRPYKDKIIDPTVHTVFGAGPREFIGWFANAEIVLTTSFHGTTFAIAFNKRFFSIVNDSPTLDCRQKSLLEELHMHGQILPMNTPLPELSRLQPDYGRVNKLLDTARQNSLDFLSKALES